MTYFVNTLFLFIKETNLASFADDNTIYTVNKNRQTNKLIRKGK